MCFLNFEELFEKKKKVNFLLIKSVLLHSSEAERKVHERKIYLNF